MVWSGFALGGVLLTGAVGFVATGIVSAVVLALLSLVFGPTFTVDAVDHAYASTPWGMDACLMAGLLCAGAFVGAWFGWRGGVRLFAFLPEESLARVPAACIGSLFLLFVLCLFYLPVPLRLTMNHAATTGHLLQLYPQDHATAAYAYVVGDKSFRCVGNPANFAKAAVGDAVMVYYSPNEPVLSILQPPDGLLLHNFLNALMASVFLGLAPFAAVAGRRWVASLPKSREG